MMLLERIESLFRDNEREIIEFYKISLGKIFDKDYIIMTENVDCLMAVQSCSVSKETFDLTVTRWTLWIKSANIIILCQTKGSLW